MGLKSGGKVPFRKVNRKDLGQNYLSIDSLKIISQSKCNLGNNFFYINQLTYDFALRLESAMLIVLIFFFNILDFRSMKKKHTLFCCTTLTFLTPTALSDDDQYWLTFLVNAYFFC